MYSEWIPLNKQEILKRVTQEEIYQIVTGYLPIASKYVTSPLRKETDKLAGAYYEWVKGILLFKDFADPRRQVRDCFQFVMEEYNLNFNDCLLFIDDYCKLGITSGNPSPILYQFVNYSSRLRSEINKSKREERKIIETRARSFNDYDKNYWNYRFGISKANLIDDNVFPTIWYKFFSPKRNEYITVRPMDICYTYSEFGDGFKKVYRPLNETFKWITNLDENHIYNIDNLPIRGEKLLITKSYKACRIVRNQDIRNTIGFQSETMFPKPEILNPLCQRFNKIVVFYDNDMAGILGSERLVNEINSVFPDKASSVFISNLSIKDIDIMYEKQGRKQVQQFLKQIY